MNVLWVNNIAIPQISKVLGAQTFHSGGWLVKLAEDLSALDGINLTIACPYKEEQEGVSGNIKFFTFNFNKKKNSVKKCSVRAKEIIEAVNPDVIHIFGTEGIHSYIFSETAKMMELQEKVVVSIQGLVSIYAKHYEAFLPHYVVKQYSLRDIYKGNVAAGKRRFESHGRSEIATLKNVNHIIGRTDWDKACTEQINPTAQYHFNNETLRNSFYTSEKWDYKTCERHSIFMSQAGYPIKGLHLALEALTIVKKFFPDTKLYVAGKSYYKKSKIKLSCYEKYILRYIDKYGLRSSVIFTDYLDEKQMANRYLKSNVFVSASSIENSPNSLGEAMLLGVPCVSSQVGGVHNLLEHGKEGYLYAADAPYMLAYYVCELFRDEKRAKDFSRCAQEHAAKTHDPINNLQVLLNIYGKIANESNHAQEKNNND